MDEAQLAELHVLRERVVAVQALQVLLHFCRIYEIAVLPADQFLLFKIATCMTCMRFSL